MRERLISETSREPTAQEIAKELEVSHEEIVFALDAIQDPVSLFEPIYNDGGDPIYVMDQISDERNKDSQWIEELASNPGGPVSIANPANYPEAFATGATDIDNRLADFSLQGPSPYDETKPEISAPGVNIRSSVPGSGYQESAISTEQPK